jgi:hypothetical protein
VITPLELWSHALALAVPPRSDEVGRRLAVSRLYYATFHAVGQHLSFDTGPPHGHQRLIDHLKQSRAQQQIIAGGRLESLREARVKADYKLGASVVAHEVMSAVHHAAAVHKQLGLSVFVDASVSATASRTPSAPGEQPASDSTPAE